MGHTPFGFLVPGAEEQTRTHSVGLVVDTFAACFVGVLVVGRVVVGATAATNACFVGVLVVGRFFGVLVVGRAVMIEACTGTCFAVGFDVGIFVGLTGFDVGIRVGVRVGAIVGQGPSLEMDIPNE